MGQGLLINIDVPDLDAATAFYCQGLGCSFRRRLFGGSVAELSCGSARIFLLEQDAGSDAVAGRAIARDYARHWTPVHLDIVVDDVTAAVATAVAAGAVAPAQIRDHPWGRLAPMSDPFGNGFCLVEFLGTGYDMVADT